jgi:assimilatory nitrate reductase catalytic subunit
VLLSTDSTLNRAALDWAIDLLDRQSIEPGLRRFVVAPRPPGGAAVITPLVCSCFGVRRNAVAAAIADGSCSVESVGRATGAGTNCGSCRAEIRQLIAAQTRVAGMSHRLCHGNDGVLPFDGYDGA